MKKTGLKNAALALILALSLGQTAQAATLNALINRQTVAVGDQFQLTVTTDATTGAMPDLTPLQEDFQVLGTSQSMRTQIINGRQSQERSWIVTLSPKQQGQLTIPALSADGLTTTPLTINVVEPSALPKSQGVPGVRIEAEVSDGNHYLYQEIPLVVRIETPLSIKRAELIAPSGAEFELTQNGQDRSSRLMKNGQQVSVIERHYHLRPQQTGTVTIPPFTIRGEVDDPNARQGPFGRTPFGGSLMRDFPFGGSAFGSSLFNDMFNPGKPFAARTDPLSLEVKAAAGDDANEWFLPAKTVELSSQWQPENPQFRVGEAVTRQISILALGARPEQLPDLEFISPDGARVYVDDNTTDTFSSAGGTIGRRVITTSVVPTTGGQVTLPEITLNWWDTDAGETRTARIPAETIKVSGGVAQLDEAAGPAIGSAVDAPPAVQSRAGSALLDNKWMLGGGLLILLGALGWASVRYIKPNSAQTSRDRPVAAENRNADAQRRFVEALSALKTAARNGDNSKTYQAALSWKRNCPFDVTIPDSFETELRSLESTLYHSSKGPGWNSRTLLKIAEQTTRSSRTAGRKKTRLPSLYPESTKRTNRGGGVASPVAS